ncbi:MAG: hypothetical protein NC206_11035 [Bacteroides sp.]|nr:hypothetical protein [Roseburia sp.]MCM1347603.1 hypothetical protein [Bacteroides sp.]MCM1422047.1 hypothetical protein [Bacteroides sp.]
MKHSIFLMSALCCSLTASAQSWKLTDMTSETFSNGGGERWMFEKYSYQTGLYNKLAVYTDESTCNYLDIYQPERVGGERITEIDNVSPSGENTWASNIRWAWCDYTFETPRTNSVEKFIYVAQDPREGFGYEVMGNNQYTSVISFVVPEDGYYSVAGTVIREDGDSWIKTLDILPRYRYKAGENQNYVDSKLTMGLSFSYGQPGGIVEGYDAAKNAGNLANGAAQKFVAQTPTSFGMAFSGKAGDIISFEVNTAAMELESTWARDYWSRTFWRQLDVTKVTEDEAKASEHFVDPYSSADVDVLLSLMDEYTELAWNFELGDDYGQYSAEAKRIYDAVCEEIGLANDAGYIHSMTYQLYMDKLQAAWQQLIDSKVTTDFNAEGNYSLFRFNTIDNEVVYDTEVMANNGNTPWGFYAYTVATGEYEPFANHNTGSTFGSSEIAAWNRKGGEWLYISDNGNLHPMTDVDPAIMFTAPKDGVYKVALSCYRPNPNVKVENPLYIRNRFMKASEETCASSEFIFAKEFGSVANDGQSGKAPIDMNFFVNMREGDKLTFELECYTSGRNSSAGTQITNLTVCSCANADSVFTTEIAEASGMDYYDPYRAGDPTLLNEAIAYADSIIAAHDGNVGNDGGQYSQEAYDALVEVRTRAVEVLENINSPENTQVVVEKLSSELVKAADVFDAARNPYEKVIAGNHGMRIDGTEKHFTQKDLADPHYYGGFFTLDEVIKATTDPAEYNWIFEFVATETGTELKTWNGYVTLDGYVMAGENDGTNVFTFYTMEKDDEVFSVRRSDGKYWSNSFSWKSPYDKVNVTDTPNYIFVIDDTPLNEETAVGIGGVENGSAVATVVKTQYFTLGGVQIVAPQNGINIRKRTLDNGNVITDKFIKY